MRKWHTFKVDPSRVSFAKTEPRPYAVGGSYLVLLDGTEAGVVSKVRASLHRYSDSGTHITGTSHSWKWSIDEPHDLWRSEYDTRAEAADAIAAHHPTEATP